MPWLKAGSRPWAPKVLGVPVTLEDVDIALLSGKNMRAGLTQLVINNPEGYETASAVSLPDIRVHVDWNSLLTDTVIVEEVLIVAPAITFEWSLRGSKPRYDSRERQTQYSLRSRWRRSRKG